MANSWLRLWHDMPTDPKWRTIARTSGQTIGNVMSVYVHVLVCASNATERGRTQSFNSEDVASALDIETEQVDQIVGAMQGRVLDGDLVKGWETRQVAREDGSAERSKAWREAKKAEKKADSTDSERNRTHGERKQTPDTDTDKEQEKTVKTAPIGFTPPNWINLQHWQAWHSSPKRKKATNDQKQMAVDKLDAWRQNGEDFAAALENAAVGGYQGLFLPDKKPSQSGATETAYQRSMREKMEVMAPAIAAKAPGVPRTNPNNFFDALPNAKPLEIAQ